MDSMAGAHKIVTNQTKTDVQLRSKTIESIHQQRIPISQKYPTLSSFI